MSDLAKRVILSRIFLIILILDAFRYAQLARMTFITYNKTYLIMQTIKDILKKFDPMEDKYISREFQAFGVHLAEKLGDTKHKSLYIRLAKTIPRPILEQAYRFVIDSKAKSKGALFMWKLKEMNAFVKSPKSQVRSPKNNKSEVSSPKSED